MRLTFLAICILFYFFNISCSNPPQNQQISVETRIQTTDNAVNLNTATESDLEKLPKIGKGIAKRIIEYRERYGNFKRAEHLILVRGISDKKFREIQALIKVE
ncbi:MAG: helix-hairpin-helix domain-containing protein [Acidobacteriota bacterium]